ncbi:hypothetical protein A3A36_00940 [Candidatus Kaiserbacteria bacterium RIFCSPLOWO2_01_FULL_52_12b]|uniref:Uncharacterized protein n=1 Tax=Candidatus Kaiserbacteria bacterium RIFCSPLOWO2_01_FULL_52_12b TaxID=1798509 RepID=A0A1F6EWP0_9BACT|nr:MAG: hypothetical protein A3A36_00940 [Candidatus Kaiserbacteria bacterium RIFCSPLOWO2_01_FULL_52_12b]
MKKISRFATLLILAAFFNVPSLASAQSCTSEGGPCSFGGRTGVCLNNGEGDFYCNVAGSTTNGVQSIPGTSASGVNPATSGIQQTPSSGGGININVIKPYSDSIINIINSILVPVLMAIAFIVFLWGVFKYFIWGADNETERATGRQFILWGIIGFVVILSVWGLVAIVGGAVGLQLGGSAPKPPTF